MKKVTLNIPDSKYAFFMELIASLGFVKTEVEDIPESHKEVVRQRMQSANSDEYMSWKEARTQFTFKGKS